MDQISDSEAATTARTLPQHQAALTLIQARLSSPAITSFRWLDLACGRGQIIRFLHQNLSVSARSKISYVGFDISNAYARETERLAEGLGFRSKHLEVGDLSKFKLILGQTDAAFDFITLTNTVHEVTPDVLSGIFLDAISSLSAEGVAFVYDMERISPPELGALPWTRDEIQKIIFALLDGLGCPEYRPEVSQWTHKTVNGWNVQIDRRYISLSEEGISANLSSAGAAASETIRAIVRGRLESCIETLEAVTRYGAETAEEERSKTDLLYELWGTYRALEHSK